jgi:hypothetical protein
MKKKNRMIISTNADSSLESSPLRKKPDTQKEVLNDDNIEECEECTKHTPDKAQEVGVVSDEDLEPYREIEFTDGHGFYIKTLCNLVNDGRIQVVQYREHTHPEGTKFAYSEPTFFENKEAFLNWFVELLVKNFDDIPYITIKPVDPRKAKKHEKETTDTMYL